MQNRRAQKHKMKIIAIYNIKGGVGKTATAVNLAYLASVNRFYSLIWDLDPQGAASFYFRVSAKTIHKGKKLLHDMAKLDDEVKATNYAYLDLIPADFSYRNFDLVLDEFNNPVTRLFKVLKQFRDQYDFVFLDCPPGITLLSENIFRAADIILVPTIPTTLSLRTLDQLLKFFRKKHIEDTRVLPFFSMVDRRKQMHRYITENPPKLACDFMQHAIPYASDIERMGVERDAVAEFRKLRPAALAYDALWQELVTHLKQG
jgi:cellulose biosynthesis protein BcsQ